MEKRAYNRIPVNLKVTFSSCDNIYAGNTMNISERGLFISTSEISFPFDVEFELTIHSIKSIICIPVCLKRLVRLSQSAIGIAGFLLKPAREYLELGSNFKISYETGANV